MSAETDALLNQLTEKLLSQPDATGGAGGTGVQLPDLSAVLPMLPPLPPLPDLSQIGFAAPEAYQSESMRTLVSLLDASGLSAAAQRLSEAAGAFVAETAQAFGSVGVDTDAVIGSAEVDLVETADLVANAPMAVGIGAAFTAIVLASRKQGPNSLPLQYDLDQIMGYYNARPTTLWARLAEIWFELGVFAWRLWRDKNTGNWERNMPLRAAQLRGFVSRAGPAYIKIGQGVSVRPDILPEPYLKELQLLQDKVQPFSSAEARAIIEQQMGVPLGDVFDDVSAFEEPVASASLGQVYRAKLLTGDAVAVKVQRPDMLQRVTLDLYVIRIILLTLANVPSIADSCLSLLAVVDNWAVRFVQELDYEQEARNGDRFRTEMAASRAFGEAIIVPKTYTQLTSRLMLVTEWVDGVKVSSIDAAAPGGRERLSKIVATLLNAYLTQLLESGFLHADPHPGNFLCTPDGRLCILDYGLMTEVTEAQRYALLEYVSHLTAKDYEATLDDLIVLGFIPKEIGEDPEKAKIVAPLLATVLEQLSNGGGAKAITVETVGEEVEELGKQYPLSIPSWFGLVVRSFGALEGLGLQLDPGYSIVQACMPYLSRRLLTEDSPRMRKMLRAFLYGKEGRYLNVERVDEIVSGYSSFTALAAEASTPDAARGRTGLSPAAAMVGAPAFAGAGMAADGHMQPPAAAAAAADPLSDPVARDALQLLFAADGNYVQDLVVEELVRMTDALGREFSLALLSVLRRAAAGPLSPASLLRAFTAAPLPLMGPLRTRLQVRDEALARVSDRLELAISLTQEDKESLSALRRLIEIARGATSGSGAAAARGPGGILVSPLATIRSPAEAAETARRVAALVATIGPGARAMLQRYATALVTRSLNRLADGLDPSGNSAAASAIRVDNVLPPLLPPASAASAASGAAGAKGRRQPFQNSRR